MASPIDITWRSLEQKKAGLLKDLQQLEQKIYNIEGKYLEDSLPSGNILVGWSSFLPKSSSLVDQNVLNKISEQKLKSEFSSSPGKKKRQGSKSDEKSPKKPRLQDRIFSLSSTTSPVYIEIEKIVNEKHAEDDLQGKEDDKIPGKIKDATDQLDNSTLTSSCTKKSE